MNAGPLFRVTRLVGASTVAQTDDAFNLIGTIGGDLVEARLSALNACGDDPGDLTADAPGVWPDPDSVVGLARPQIEGLLPSLLVADQEAEVIASASDSGVRGDLAHFIPALWDHLRTMESTFLRRPGASQGHSGGQPGQDSGARYALAESRTAEALARLGLLIMAGERPAIDSGFWVLAQELLWEKDPHYHSSLDHRAWDPPRAATSRLCDPRWAEVAMARLKEVEERNERRHRLAFRTPGGNRAAGGGHAAGGAAEVATDAPPRRTRGKGEGKAKDQPQADQPQI